MIDLNIITANLSHGKQYVTASRYMEDYGQVLKIEGIDLPSVYQVDFSNNLMRGTSMTVLGNADGVAIPDEYISTGRDVYAFLYLTGDMWGRTIATIRIPNKTRPTRTDAIPTPTQQGIIDQAIAALNDAVESTAADAEQTASDAARAEAARTAAESAASSAEASATAAAQSEANAAQSESTASAAATSASASAASAATSATTATTKASEATTAATTATTKAGEASTSASTATSAKDTAVSASQTATTKASEATAAAATAVSAKDDAVAANTAAQSAKTAAQTAQAGAETAAASVQSSAAQIATNTSDINELKEDLTNIAGIVGFTEVSGAFALNSHYSNIDVSATLTKGDVIVISSFSCDTATNPKVTVYGVLNGDYINLGAITDDEYYEITVTQNFDSFRFAFYRENSDTTDQYYLAYNINTQTGVIRKLTNISQTLDMFADAFVTPQMYGAKGDGTTDDTLALQNAIDSGIRVCVPKGTYLITSPLLISVDSTFIDGVNSFYWSSDGNNNATIKAGDTIDAVFEIANGVSCVNIQNININGNAKAVNGIAHIEGDNYTHDNAFKNIRIERCTQIGIKMTSVYKSIYENVRVYSCATGFDLEGKYNGSGYIFATTLTLIQCYCDGCSSSFKLSRVGYSTLINCASDHANYFNYWLLVCKNMSLINCGCEGAKRVPIMFNGISDSIKIDGFSVINLDTNLDANRSGIVVCTQVNDLIMSGLVISTTNTRTYKIENSTSDGNIIILDTTIRSADCKTSDNITFVVA